MEGALIFVAATAILWTSIQRIVNLQPIEEAGIGLVLSSLAAVVNLVVGLTLIKAGKRERSMALTADGRHLLTDVVTSVGVLVGITLVAIFDWEILDPIVALGVGVNILYTGWGLLRRSVTGLLDAALTTEDVDLVREVLDRYRSEQPVDFHALRSRESGRQRFIYVHMLVPDEWTVKRGHSLADRFTSDIRAALPGSRTFVHLEPIGDPSSYGHAGLPVDEDGSVDPDGLSELPEGFASSDEHGGDG